MPLFRNKTEFFERGVQNITPSNDLASEDCKICLAPLDLVEQSDHSSKDEEFDDLFEQTDAADHDSDLHPAVRIRCCGHIFGAECLNVWLDAGNTCPVCRRMLFLPREQPPITQHDIHSMHHDLRGVVGIDAADTAIATYLYVLQEQAASRRRQNEIQVNIERSKMEEEARQADKDNRLTAEDFGDSDVDMDEWDLDADDEDEDYDEFNPGEDETENNDKFNPMDEDENDAW